MEVLMTSPTFQERAEDLDDEDETGAEDNERDDQQDDADHKVAQVRKVEQKAAKLTLEKNQKVIIKIDFYKALFLYLYPTNGSNPFLQQKQFLSGLNQSLSDSTRHSLH